MDYVTELISTIANVDTNIYLLPTSDNDIERLPVDHKKRVNVLRLFDAEFSGFVDTLRRMRCPHNSMCLPFFGGWDLPAKRNLALWYARKHKLTRILMIDDDIRGLNPVSISTGANALSDSAISGFFVEDYPDTSVVGHVELEVGDTVQTFLSGSCLFIRTDKAIDCFPPIYNEDWLFMIPQLLTGHVSFLGSICQKTYDPFKDFNVAGFQEPGEIIADGLFALLARDRYDERLDQGIWKRLLSERKEWLASLAERCRTRRLREVINVARERLGRTSDCDCVRFVSDWETDRHLWALSLQEIN